MTYGDAYWYLASTVRFLNALSQRPLHVFSFRDLSLGGRPPLYQLLSMPFLAPGVRTEDAARYVNLFFLGVLIATTYYTARLIKDEYAGVLAAILVVCYPPIIHLSRIYLPHFAVPACVSLSVCLLTSLLVNPCAKTAWLFGASLAFGALIHPNFLPLPVVPTTVAMVYLVLFSQDPKRPRALRESHRWLGSKLAVPDPLLWRGLVPAAAIALGSTLAWYLTAGREVLGLQQQLMQRSLAELTGEKYIAIGFPDVQPGFWWYVHTAPGAITNVLGVLLAVSLVSGTASCNGLVMLLVLWFITDWAIVSVNTTLHWWYPSAVLPIAAVLTSVFVTGQRRRSLALGGTVLCLGVALFAFAVVTWGASPGLWQLAIALGAAEKECWRAEVAFCPEQAGQVVEAWPVAEIIQTITRDQGPRVGEYRSLLPLDLPGGRWRCWGAQPCGEGRRLGPRWVALLTYRFAKDAPSARLRVSDPEAPTWGRLYNFEVLRSDYVLYEEGVVPDEGPNGILAYQRATAKFLQAPPAAFVESHKRVATFQGPDGRTAALIKRVRPLTVSEAEDSIAAIQLPEPQKELGHLIFSALNSSREAAP